VKYHELTPLSREEAEAIFSRGSAEQVSDALLRVTFHDLDWRWVQAQALRFARSPDFDARWTAVICFGHLARIHGELDTAIVLPLLHDLAREPRLSGRVEDALSDIETFIQDKN
jgi:hypothetical protein